jgi:hypothetical protein
MEGPEIPIEFWRYKPLEIGHLEDQERSQYNNNLALRKTGCQDGKWTELPYYHVQLQRFIWSVLEAMGFTTIYFHLYYLHVNFLYKYVFYKYCENNEVIYLLLLTTKYTFTEM